MELKRILARDSRAAKDKAIELYGEDVLIISTQQVGDQTELIVALDAQDTPMPVQNEPSSAASQAQEHADEKREVFAEIFGFVQRQEAQALGQSASSSEPVALYRPPAVMAPGTEGGESKRSLQSMSAQVIFPPVDEAMLPPKKKAVRATSPRKEGASKPTSSKTALPKTRPEVDSPRTAEAHGPWVDVLQDELARNREIVDLLRQEVGVLRREFQVNRQLQPWQNGLNLSPIAQGLATRMDDMGVPAGLRAMLLQGLVGCADESECQISLQASLQAITQGCVMSGLTPGVHALVGPSGSGKTGMTVRLAHMHAQSFGLERQAIISMGDARPGAWSQLQALAASVGVDVYRARDEEAFKVLLSELSDRSHIWVDTAGSARFELASALARSADRIQLHAVLPQDSTVSSMQRMRDSGVQWTSLMLSKADESLSWWQWLQSWCESPMPLSFISRSACVKDAAHEFDPAICIEQVFSDLQIRTMVPQDAPTTRPVRKRKTTTAKAAHA